LNFLAANEKKLTASTVAKMDIGPEIVPPVAAVEAGTGPCATNVVNQDTSPNVALVLVVAIAGVVLVPLPVDIPGVALLRADIIAPLPVVLMVALRHAFVLLPGGVLTVALHHRAFVPLPVGGLTVALLPVVVLAAFVPLLVGVLLPVVLMVVVLLPVVDPLLVAVPLPATAAVVVVVLEVEVIGAGLLLALMVGLLLEVPGKLSLRTKLCLHSFPVM